MVKIGIYKSGIYKSFLNTLVLLMCFFISACAGRIYNKGYKKEYKREYRTGADKTSEAAWIQDSINSEANGIDNVTGGSFKTPSGNSAYNSAYKDNVLSERLCNILSDTPGNPGNVLLDNPGNIMSGYPANAKQSSSLKNAPDCMINNGRDSSYNMGKEKTDFEYFRQETESFDSDSNGFLSEEPAIAELESIQDRQDKLDEALRLCQQAQQEWKEVDPDTALETLDCAYELLIRVDSNGDAGIFQQKEDIRFLISKRIIEIYASRQRVVNGKHTEIPLIINSHVDREIKNFLGDDKVFFIDSYKRSGIYRPIILKELCEAGLPESLSWLPLIESGFKSRVLSPARALGLWQFIPSTGYKFGLERSRWIDERMDPFKSTKAAIEYLTQLHHIFGDWTTVLAAYNCGEGTVLRVIRNQHINYLDNFWDLYERLPLETARYVPKFMAALLLIENPEKYGLELPEVYSMTEYEEITINKQIQLSDIAYSIEISTEELVDLNPELRQKVTPEKEYLLKVPKNKGSQILEALDKINAWKPPEQTFVYHKVKRGETLSHIARKYRTTVKIITRANKIRRADRVRIGQTLKIPLKGAKFSSYADLGMNNSLKTYVVKKGDCAYGIAREFGMNLKEFLSINEFTEDKVIYPGQKVLIRIQ